MLTEKLRTVVHWTQTRDEDLDAITLAPAYKELFAYFRSSGRFPVDGPVKLLDVGCGDKGSFFVNAFTEEFSLAEATYLDRLQCVLTRLDKTSKVRANAKRMPFPRASFDIAYAGHVPAFIQCALKDHFLLGDDPYKIAKEIYRVLKNDGLFIFNRSASGLYTPEEDKQNVVSLMEIGFRELEHLVRIEVQDSAYYDSFDTYAARK